MLNKLMNNTKTEVNIKKDFKKVANYVALAKGRRNVNSFASDMKTDSEYLTLVINAKIGSYPTIPFLKMIADNSEGRVSLKDLTLACGYSNYANNDMEQIRNIYVRRGWIVFASYGDKGLDSEVQGTRPVLVIGNNLGCKFSSNISVLAITSRSKRSMQTHVPIGREHGLSCDSTISCELPDTITKRRIISANGVVGKITECPFEIMQQVEIALMKANGLIDNNMNVQDAIEALKGMNTQKTYQYENNYGRSTMPQVSFA